MNDSELLIRSTNHIVGAILNDACKIQTGADSTIYSTSKVLLKQTPDQAIRICEPGPNNGWIPLEVTGKDVEDFNTAVCKARESRQDMLNQLSKQRLFTNLA